jgi:hypothetical protein
MSLLYGMIFARVCSFLLSTKDECKHAFVSGVGLYVSSDTLHVEQGATATVSFTILQSCPPKRQHIATINVEYISLHPEPRDVRKPFCQMFSDEINRCYSYIPGCTCASEGPPFSVSKAVTDPDGEVWIIKGRTRSAGAVEKRVLVYVTGKEFCTSLHLHVLLFVYYLDAYSY